ncbi:triphosphoribosyl-dephospho-CoA synthase [Aminiphilus sp.]|uniref:triphosphoribosyl-dephospho-CoA synthase n=1 Tax=Aminiphilus sp. TaxID=1872488 RepID=UPI002637737A|nr:triphosphoribosyl-dephospho-CoA synthase [Aminiphilus sp.]
MKDGRTRREVVRHVELACLLEVGAPKPGNVNRFADFHDAALEDFLVSAVAVGETFRRTRRWSVGTLVLRGVAATRRLTGTNTNLGMLLLLVPLAMGALVAPRGTLRQGVREVLRGTSAEDARQVYEAIRLASPGGLGSAPTHDVTDKTADPPLLSEAMEAAAERDSVAREYSRDFECTFGLVLPALRGHLAAGADLSDAVVRTFLQVLAVVPDTLIARKAGDEEARRISRLAAELFAAAPSAAASPLERPFLREFDALLRSGGNRTNPGTTADLVAAGLFCLLSENPGGRDETVLRFRRSAAGEKFRRRGKL